MHDALVASHSCTSGSLLKKIAMNKCIQIICLINEL